MTIMMMKSDDDHHDAADKGDALPMLPHKR